MSGRTDESVGHLATLAIIPRNNTTMASSSIVTRRGGKEIRDFFPLEQRIFWFYLVFFLFSTRPMSLSPVQISTSSSRVAFAYADSFSKHFSADADAARRHVTFSVVFLLVTCLSDKSFLPRVSIAAQPGPRPSSLAADHFALLPLCPRFLVLAASSN